MAIKVGWKRGNRCVDLGGACAAQRLGIVKEDTAVRKGMLG